MVNANSPWKTVGDLLAAAKTKIGHLSCGSWGAGSVAHMGTAMFEGATGVKMTHVPFKDLPQVYTSAAGGDIDWAFGTAASAGPMVRAKKVMPLAYAGAKRLAGYGDVPTVAESGGPAGFELRTWVTLFAPKGTPKFEGVLTRLSGTSEKLSPSESMRLSACRVHGTPAISRK